MDIIGLIRATTHDYGDIFSEAWWHLINMEFKTAVSLERKITFYVFRSLFFNYLFSMCLVVCSITFFCYFFYSHLKIFKNIYLKRKNTTANNNYFKHFSFIHMLHHSYQGIRKLLLFTFYLFII